MSSGEDSYPVHEFRDSYASSATAQDSDANQRLSTESADTDSLMISVVDSIEQSLFEENPNVAEIPESLAETLKNNDANLHLPEAPSDEEKLLFVKSNHAFLLFFALLQFLTITAAMLLFLRASWIFFIFLPVFDFYISLILQYIMLEVMYFPMAFYCGFFGKEYDYQEHVEMTKNEQLPEYPLVDVLLPCYNEPLAVIKNTYDHVYALDYPNYQVWVLDDGASPDVQRLAESYDFNYIVRANRPHLKKSGNLRHAFEYTSGEFSVIFDAGLS